jgi:hypothetical protein
VVRAARLSVWPPRTLAHARTRCPARSRRIVRRPAPALVPARCGGNHWASGRAHGDHCAGRLVVAGRWRMPADLSHAIHRRVQRSTIALLLPATRAYGGHPLRVPRGLRGCASPLAADERQFAPGCVWTRARHSTSSSGSAPPGPPPPATRRAAAGEEGRLIVRFRGSRTSRIILLRRVVVWDRPRLMRMVSGPHGDGPHGTTHVVPRASRNEAEGPPARAGSRWSGGKAAPASLPLAVSKQKRVPRPWRFSARGHLGRSRREITPLHGHVDAHYGQPGNALAGDSGLAVLRMALETWPGFIHRRTGAATSREGPARV